MKKTIGSLHTFFGNMCRYIIRTLTDVFHGAFYENSQLLFAITYFLKKAVSYIHTPTHIYREREIGRQIDRQIDIEVGR